MPLVPTSLDKKGGQVFEHSTAIVFLHKMNRIGGVGSCWNLLIPLPTLNYYVSIAQKRKGRSHVLLIYIHVQRTLLHTYIGKAIPVTDRGDP
jgi:hypothetical protein